jgi:hypothetical protein
MLPEISRRCLACGAAARAGSRFCQQCGKPLDAEADAADAAPEERAAETPPATAPPPTGEWSPQEPAAPTTKDWAPPAKESAAFEQSRDPAEQTPAAGVEVGPEAPAHSAPAGEAAVFVEEGRAGGDLRGRVARVREGTRARVGRMREEAIVVLEETPPDSGLRFVLAAAALFIVFLVLLFLSTTVLR